MVVVADKVLVRSVVVACCMSGSFLVSPRRCLARFCDAINIIIIIIVRNS